MRVYALVWMLFGLCPAAGLCAGHGASATAAGLAPRVGYDYVRQYSKKDGTEVTGHWRRDSRTKTDRNGGERSSGDGEGAERSTEISDAQSSTDSPAARLVDNAVAGRNPILVCVLTQGQYYHRHDHLVTTTAMEEVTPEDAISRGYGCCPECMPPTASAALKSEASGERRVSLYYTTYLDLRRNVDPNETPPPGGGPSDFAQCINPRCTKPIKATVEICPYCDTPQTDRTEIVSGYTTKRGTVVASYARRPGQ